MNPVLTWQQGWRYGLMGLPLAFVALPLYVLLPNYYARSFGVSLATLGAVLVAVRLFDTLIDPLLGRWADNLHRHSGTAAQAPATVLRWAALAALLLCTGFGLLFFPPAPLQADTTQVMLWLGATLLLTTVAFSALTILHQAWGARLGGDALYRSRVVAWREGLGLVGVIIASVAPVALGLPATVTLLVIASVGGWLAWRSGPVPMGFTAEQVLGPRPRLHPEGKGTATDNATAGAHAQSLDVGHGAASLWLPWQRTRFRQLMGVFMVNGIASAIPATLLLFFVQDRLQAPPSMEPLFLGAYFVCAALSIPLWLKLVPRFGLARTWGVGMVLSVLVFAFAARLGAGDVAEFVIVCALSGAALGTDLALPAALLAGVIQHHGDQQQSEGAYFGWWAFATKLNLALAAGVALPVLGLLGYVPGTTDPQALQTLTFAYCLLPCALKTLAAALLYFLIIRKNP